jgi:hypothetical protein
MTVTSYRLYCEDCDNETVVRGDESKRDTNWSVGSLINHNGTCPSCDPTVDLDELQKCDEYHESVDLLALDGIGQKAASNLERAGYDTVEKIAEASDEDLLDVRWVGEGGLLSLRERAKQLEPQQRWQ